MESSHQLKLYSQLSKVGTIEEFRQTAMPLSNDAILNRDTLSLLVLSEYCAAWNEWHTAAEILVHAIGNSLSSTQDESACIFQADYVLLLHSDRHSWSLSKGQRIGSRVDVVLHSVGGALHALSRTGLPAKDQSKWLQIALIELVRQDLLSADDLYTNIVALQPGSPNISKRLSSQVGRTRGLLKRTYLEVTELNGATKEQSAKDYLALTAAIISSLCIGYALADLITIPGARVSIGPVPIFNVLLVAWPLLLFSTWIFAYHQSRRDSTITFVSPKHFINPRNATFGVSIPFSQDWFYHIFQFFWIPFLIISLVLFHGLANIGQSASSLWSTSQNQRDELNLILSALNPNLLDMKSLGSGAYPLLNWATSDHLAIAIGTPVALGYTIAQLLIQSTREENQFNIYWWNRQINNGISSVRIGMLAIDVLLCAYVVVKILGVIAVAYGLVSNPGLQVSYFAMDGVGGLGFIADIFQKASWIVLVVGAFVMCSIYLHRGLPEYKISDATIFCIYVALVAVAIAPLFALESRLNVEREHVLSAISMMPNEMKDLRNIQQSAVLLHFLIDVRNWQASVFGSSFFNFSYLVLGFQAAAATYQFFSMLVRKKAADELTF